MYRQGFRRPDTVCVSEAGQDHLVGVADAGQSDHFGAPKVLGRANFADSERTPWHDIATHGYYVLFAGGLGGRYQEEDGWHSCTATLPTTTSPTASSADATRCATGRSRATR